MNGPEKSPTDGEKAKVGTDHFDNKPWMRFVGLGMGLATSTLVLAGLGYAFDLYRGHATLFGTAFGGLAGFTVGMVRFIKQASQSVDN